MWGHMPQNSYPKKVGSKVDIKCDLFLLKTVEIKAEAELLLMHLPSVN